MAVRDVYPTWLSNLQTMVVKMSSEAIATVVKMMESLPEPAQNQMVEHFRSYLMEVQDELRWDELFNKTQSKLVAMARLAKEQIAEGKARPLDYNKL